MDYCKKIGEQLIRRTNGGIRWMGVRFNTKDSYVLLAAVQDEVEWHTLIWNNLNMPKDQFYAWIVDKGRLRTLDKLISWMPHLSNVCVLCRNEVETNEHLYFECHFSKEVNQRISRKYGCEDMPQRWSLFNNWVKNIHGGRGKRKILTALVTRMLAEIWRCRNHLIF